jgi:predicted HD phosphohydrolase
VKQITDLFDRHGESRYGEHVNQREHMLQCAKLAEDAEDTPAMIAAALLHDVGQFLEGAGDAAEDHGYDAAHEKLGEAFLSQWFPEEVTAPIALHVAAKRYLCAVEPGYLEGLMLLLNEGKGLHHRWQGPVGEGCQPKAFFDAYKGQ